jgi:hypothetical protein
MTSLYTIRTNFFNTTDRQNKIKTLETFDMYNDIEY